MDVKPPIEVTLRPSRRRTATRQVIDEFNRSLVLIVDPDALQASVAARIKELFRPDLILIFQLDPDRGVFSPSFSAGFSQEDLAGVKLARRGRLARWLLVNETCFIVSRAPGVYEYLSETEQEMLVRMNIRVCVPLISLNRLTGVIMLGSPRADWELDQPDIELLELLASQAGLAFENAYLYCQQRDRLRRLYRAERLAAAGQLAAGVAHEIRNPLTAIRSTVQYILRDYPEPHPKRTLIDELLTEVDRIDRTVNGLLTLTRPSEFEPEPVDIIDVLEQSLVLVSAQAQRQAVQLGRQYARQVFHVMGDASQLKQVFLNLLLNALQATPSRGTLTVTVETVRSEMSPPGGTWVQIKLSDTGIGIPAEDLDKIFDPFFTTKRDGTGLGLSICHGIIQRHEGEIDVQSEVGQGTVVSLRLPLM